MVSSYCDTLGECRRTVINGWMAMLSCARKEASSDVSMELQPALRFLAKKTCQGVHVPLRVAHLGYLIVHSITPLMLTASYLYLSLS